MKYMIMLLMALLVACAGGPGFDEEGEELGSLEQGMGTKFSPTFSYGVSKTTGQKCWVSLGGGSSDCMLPGYGTMRYKFVGNDPRESHMSWKYQTSRAFRSFRNFVVGSGYGFPWAYVEDPANAWITIKTGTCPGSADDNFIHSIGCIEWNGNQPLVSESLPGNYRRFVGAATVIIDIAKIEYITNHPGTSYDADFHQILEHAAHATIPRLFGSGIYPTAKRNPNSSPTWSSPFVYDSGSNWGYDAGGFTDGEACRAGNWSGQFNNSFGPLNGSCAD